nr:hypothetical protein CFP56_00790 [Quercus suber]
MQGDRLPLLLLSTSATRSFFFTLYQEVSSSARPAHAAAQQHIVRVAVEALASHERRFAKDRRNANGDQAATPEIVAVYPIDCVDEQSDASVQPFGKKHAAASADQSRKKSHFPEIPLQQRGNRALHASGRT